MSVSTNFKLLNSNDPKYIEARTGEYLVKDCWEDDNGLIEYAPGKQIEIDQWDYVEETDEEYGGWIIDLSKIPENATHIKVTRS